MSAVIPYAVIAGLFGLVVFFAWRWKKGGVRGAEGELAKKDLKLWGRLIEAHHKRHSQPLESSDTGAGWRRLRNKNRSN